MPEQENVGETLADWLSEQAGRQVAFEKLEPGDEQVLPDRDQRELDSLPSSRLAALDDS